MIKRFVLSTMLLSAAAIGNIAMAQPVAAFDYTTTKNKYVEIGGARYAYRTIGDRGSKPPLVLFQHFTGTMDDWDRRTIEGLAKERELIIFDNAGVGESGGQSPDNVAAMAEIAVRLIESLKLQQVDALGFSLGGSIVQQLLIEKPSLIRKAVLVGSTPQGSSGFRQIPDVVSTAIKRSGETGRPLRALLFFTDTETGKAEADEYLKSINNHSVDPETPVSEQTMAAQAKALVTWGSMPENGEQLARIKQPVLIVNGSDDIIAPTLESVTLFQRIPNAQLSLYPDSGHGSLFQHDALFVSQVHTFLDGTK